MKIAYLIVVHDNFRQLSRLLLALDDANVKFWLHIDQETSAPPLPRTKAPIELIPRKRVFWGSYSLQNVINSLMKTATSSGADYYVLLSGTDYPIKSRKQLYAKLNRGGEYINLWKGFLPHKPESRIKYYYFEGANRKNKKSLKTLVFFALELLQKKIKVIRKRNYPFKEVYHGATWWALSHSCVEYVLNYIDNHPEYSVFFKTSWIPDETYMHTIIGNSPFRDKAKGCLTYTDWSAQRSSPAWISKKHLGVFSDPDNPFYFARKFNDNSEDTIKAIDKIISPSSH